MAVRIKRKTEQSITPTRKKANPAMVSVYDTGESLWNPYRDGVTQGLLQKFLTCPEKLRLSCVDGIQPIARGVMGNPALAFGNLFHETLDTIYTSHRESPLYLSSIRGVIRDCLRESEQRDRQILNTAMNSTPEDLNTLEENYGFAEIMLTAYFEHWKEDFETFEWVGLEETFSVPYTSPSQTVPIQIRGKFDGIFRVGGKLWLFETKTKGRIEEDSICDRLPYDLQVCLYLWAMEKIYGESPQGVVYNLVRRPQLRRSVKESLPEFLERVSVDVTARPAFYFIRYNVSFLEDERTKWKTEFDGIVDQLMSWWWGKFHYRDSTACSSRFGNCEFLPVCGRNDRTNYERRSEVFPELNQLED